MVAEVDVDGDVDIVVVVVVNIVVSGGIVDVLIDVKFFFPGESA